MWVRKAPVNEIRNFSTESTTGRKSVSLDNDFGKDVEILDISLTLWMGGATNNGFTPVNVWTQDPTPSFRRDWITSGRFIPTYNGNYASHHWHGNFIWKRGKRLIIEWFVVDASVTVRLDYVIKWRAINGQ